MAQILLILALVFQPVAFGAAMVGRSDCGREFPAAAVSCHEPARPACCCDAGSMRAASRRAAAALCPCLQRPEGPQKPESPAPAQPTLVAAPHLLLCRVGAMVSPVGALPLRFAARGDSFTPAASPTEARSLLCIWLT